MTGAAPRARAARELPVRFAEVSADERALRIEYAWVNAERADAPLLVFLHEGLGSLAMWKEFPQALCDGARMRGLVYSRPGYGRSTPRRAEEKWPVDFNERHAQHVLPALLDNLAVAAPVWLFGHSDGASIALLFAAAFPTRVAGAIVAAPHLFVEDVSIASIEEARGAYVTGDLKRKLAPYHDEPDSAFFGWNDVWLDPAFRSWNIEACLPRIRCPILALQGEDDVYGTMAQIDAIARALPEAQLLKLSRCGHSPHRDATAAVIRSASRFIAGARDTA